MQLSAVVDVGSLRWLCTCNEYKMFVLNMPLCLQKCLCGLVRYVFDVLGQLYLVVM